jgi:hypothetical protein
MFCSTTARDRETACEVAMNHPSPDVVLGNGTAVIRVLQTTDGCLAPDCALGDFFPFVTPFFAVLIVPGEETRQSAETPVLRSLREGGAVGLANHSLLIGRDGTERPSTTAPPQAWIRKGGSAEWSR